MNPRSIPKLSHHKASGRAVVRLDGQDCYVGPWGSKAAVAEYDRLIVEWLAGGRQIASAQAGEMTVTELIATFWTHAESYYRNPDGTVTGEIHCFRDALKPLRRLYGHTLVTDFGPLALKAVRQAMIDAGHCRSHINRQIGRIKRAFRWGVENELVPSSVIHGLEAVAGLKAGRSGVRESAPVKPVAENLIMAVLPFVSRQVGAMIQVQLLTGMRPGETVTIRGVDIEMSGKLWLYRPAKHKTKHLGHDRVIMFGPKAQQILKLFLKSDLHAPLFAPVDAEEDRRRAADKARETPRSCGNVRGSNVRRKPRKKPGVGYSVDSYGRAIKYGCERAFPVPDQLSQKVLPNGKLETKKAWLARLTPVQKEEIRTWRKSHSWHPHQLRHNAATNLRKTFGLEAAQVVLGHRTLSVTEIYAEKNTEAAKRIMTEVG